MNVPLLFQEFQHILQSLHWIFYFFIPVAWDFLQLDLSKHEELLEFFNNACGFVIARSFRQVVHNVLSEWAVTLWNVQDLSRSEIFIVPLQGSQNLLIAVMSNTLNELLPSTKLPMLFALGLSALVAAISWMLVQNPRICVGGRTASWAYLGAVLRAAWP